MLFNFLNLQFAKFEPTTEVLWIDYYNKTLGTEPVTINGGIPIRHLWHYSFI